MKLLCRIFVICALGYQSAAAASANQVTIPDFSVQVILDEEATTTLAHLHENILVHAEFSGWPKNRPLPEWVKTEEDATITAVDSTGGIFIASKKMLTAKDGLASFNNITISNHQINRVKDKKVYLGIIVVSARKSSRSNLLDCATDATQAGPIEKFAGQTITVSCKLIGSKK